MRIYLCWLLILLVYSKLSQSESGAVELKPLPDESATTSESSSEDETEKERMFFQKFLRPN